MYQSVPNQFREDNKRSRLDTLRTEQCSTGRHSVRRRSASLHVGDFSLSSTLQVRLNPPVEILCTLERALDFRDGLSLPEQDQSRQASHAEPGCNGRVLFSVKFDRLHAHFLETTSTLRENIGHVLYATQQTRREWEVGRLESTSASPYGRFGNVRETRGGETSRLDVPDMGHTTWRRRPTGRCRTR